MISHKLLHEQGLLYLLCCEDWRCHLLAMPGRPDYALFDSQLAGCPPCSGTIVTASTATSISKYCNQHQRIWTENFLAGCHLSKIELLVSAAHPRPTNQHKPTCITILKLHNPKFYQHDSTTQIRAVDDERLEPA